MNCWGSFPKCFLLCSYLSKYPFQLLLTCQRIIFVGFFFVHLACVRVCSRQSFFQQQCKRRIKNTTWPFDSRNSQFDQPDKQIHSCSVFACVFGFVCFRQTLQHYVDIVFILWSIEKGGRIFFFPFSLCEGEKIITQIAVFQTSSGFLTQNQIWCLLTHVIRVSLRFSRF